MSQPYPGTVGSYPAASTPVPSVHVQRPAPALPQLSTFGTLGEALVDEVVGSIAMAIGNTTILGVKPLSFLSTWGQNLENQGAALLTNLYGPGTTEPQPNILTTALPKGFQNLGADVVRIVQDVLAGVGLSSTGSWADLSSAFQQLETDVETSLDLPTLPTAPTIAQDIITTGEGWITDIQSAATTASNDVTQVVESTIGAFAPGVEQTIENVGSAIGSFVNGLFGQSTAPAAGSTITAGFVGQASAAASAAQSTANSAAGVAQSAQTAASGAQSTAQGVVDAIHQATYGGNATGTAVSAVAQALQAIPQANVVVNPSAGNQKPVAFDAAGAGGATGPFGLTEYGTSISWTHTAGANANYLIIPVYYPAPLTTGYPSFTATAVFSGGTIAVNTIAQQGTPETTVVLGAFIEPSATYTITLTCTIDGASVTAPGFVAASASYCNVTQFGVTSNTAGGTGSAALSLATSSQESNAKALSPVFFGNAAGSQSAAALSALTGGLTQRFDVSFAAGSGAGLSLVMGDFAPAGGSPTFGATSASASNTWQAAQVVLTSSSDAVGSYGFATRAANSSFTMTAPSGSTPMLPTNAYDTTTGTTTDLALVNGNTWQVTYAGTYLLEVFCAFEMGGSSTGFWEGVVSVDGVQHICSASAIVSGQPGIRFTATVYCQPGSQVTWGGYAQYGTSLPSSQFNGNSLSYMRLALLNRSYY